VPKELIARYVKNCPTCVARRQAKKEARDAAREKSDDKRKGKDGQAQSSSKLQQRSSRTQNKSKRPTSPLSLTDSSPAFDLSAFQTPSQSSTSTDSRRPSIDEEAFAWPADVPLGTVNPADVSGPPRAGGIPAFQAPLRQRNLGFDPPLVFFSRRGCFLSKR
jgi:hypothetical protein